MKKINHKDWSYSLLWKVDSITVEWNDYKFYVQKWFSSQQIFFVDFNKETKKELISFEFPEMFTQRQRMLIAKIVLVKINKNYGKELHWKLSYNKRLDRWIYEINNFYYEYKKEK